MENTNIYDFLDYRKYLEFKLPISGEKRGSRSQLAHRLNCQTAFVSQVLRGDANFSLEHGMEINRFLGHSEQESDYLFLLLQYARSGTKDLEEYLLQKIKSAQETRKFIKQKNQASLHLSLEDQAKYYSAWYYAAIHMLILTPMRAPETIAQHLALPQSKVSQVLEFLNTAGLVIRNGRHYSPGKTRIHLSQDSDLIAKHHANWRLQAIRAADLRMRGDEFFSGPLSISEKDANRIRSSLQNWIATLEPVIQSSTEEVVYCLNFDFFRV